MDHESVQKALQLKKDLVLGSGFHFLAKEEGSEDIVDFLSQALHDGLQTPFLDQGTGLTEGVSQDSDIPRCAISTAGDKRGVIAYERHES